MVRTAVRKKVQLEEGHIMKKICGILAVLSFLYVLGTVGGMEQDTMNLSAGTLRVCLGLGCFWMFCELSGAVGSAPPPRKRKSR